MLSSFGVWAWPALGLALIAIEVLVIPGGFLLWFGLAALAMGGVTWLFPMGWQAEMIMFGVLAVVAGLIAWKLHHGKDRATDAADGLHDRGGQLIGRSFELEEAIKNGFGRVRIDDTLWRVAGRDMPKGGRVKVVGLDGATLRVEPG